MKAKHVSSKTTHARRDGARTAKTRGKMTNVAQTAGNGAKHAKAKIGKVTKGGGHRAQERREKKARHGAKELATKVVQALEETAQKVIHGAKEVASKARHRREERVKPRRSKSRIKTPKSESARP